MQALTKEVVWIRLLAAELRLSKALSEPTVVVVDNDGVVKQSTKAVNHSTAKHYRVAQAFIRSAVDDLALWVEPVHTSLNPADMFTKALPRDSFTRHRRAIMGPQENPGE